MDSRGMVAFLCLGLLAGPAVVHAQQPSTQSASEVSVQVYSVRVSRHPDLLREFRPTPSNLAGSGIAMQLLLRFDRASLLPLPRDAVMIDTLVDDTYQNLLAGVNASSP